MFRRRNDHSRAPAAEKPREHVSHVSGRVAIEDNVQLLGMPETTLECFGGKKGFNGFLDFLENAKKSEIPQVAVAVVDGVDLYPGTGIPSLFIAPDAESAHDGGQQLMFSAMMAGQYTPGVANIYEGREAIPYIDNFLAKALEVLAPELNQDEIERAKALITAEE